MKKKEKVVEWPNEIDVHSAISPNEKWKTATHVREKIEKRTGKLVSLKTFFDSLFSLEEKGLIETDTKPPCRGVIPILILRRTQAIRDSL
jgi:hypothetical protein